MQLDKYREYLLTLHASNYWLCFVFSSVGRPPIEMADHRNFGEDKRTSESLVIIGLRKPAMATSTESEMKSDSDTDNQSCYATEVTSSDERLFREMASVEYQSEDDQFEEESRSREEGSRDEGSREEGDQMQEENQLQRTQLSLIDDETLRFLSHTLPESDG